MPEKMIGEKSPKSNIPRLFYTQAYSELRQFYTSCNLGSYTDAELMNAKYALWLVHGKYLDLAWQHHFSNQVSQTTGIGSWHGWNNAKRLHAYAKDWSRFYTNCVIPF